MARLFRRRGAAAAPPVEPSMGSEPAERPAAVDADAPADSPETPSKRRRWIGPIQIVVVLAIIVAAFLYARAPGRDAGAPPVFANLQDDPLPIVNIVRPLASPTKIQVDATGTVNVRNYVSLTPQVGGRVVSISPALRAGGTFAADEQLLIIDRRDFELALDQARADIAAAQSTLMLQRAESDAARANYALLHPNDAVPPLVARIPQIAQARAQLSAARARSEIAALNLKRTSFSLPFDGRVTESTAEVGQVLLAGQSFGRAFAFDALEVVVPIAADELERIEAGDWTQRNGPRRLGDDRSDRRARLGGTRRADPVCRALPPIPAPRPVRRRRAHSSTWSSTAPPLNARSYCRQPPNRSTAASGSSPKACSSPCCPGRSATPPRAGWSAPSTTRTAWCSAPFRVPKPGCRWTSAARHETVSAMRPEVKGERSPTHRPTARNRHRPGTDRLFRQQSGRRQPDDGTHARRRAARGPAVARADLPDHRPRSDPRHGDLPRRHANRSRGGNHAPCRGVHLRHRRHRPRALHRIGKPRHGDRRTEGLRRRHARARRRRGSR